MLLFEISTAHQSGKCIVVTSYVSIENYIHFFFHCFSEKIRLDVSSESSARQRIHMKNQALFFFIFFFYHARNTREGSGSLHFFKFSSNNILTVNCKNSESVYFR